MPTKFHRTTIKVFSTVKGRFDPAQSNPYRLYIPTNNCNKVDDKENSVSNSTINLGTIAIADFQQPG